MFKFNLVAFVRATFPGPIRVVEVGTAFTVHEDPKVHVCPFTVVAGFTRPEFGIDELVIWLPFVTVPKAALISDPFNTIAIVPPPLLAYS
jgi:hypothetical protein